MSDLDQGSKRKQRSPINAIKLLNLLREERGLPKIAKASKSANGKKKLTREERNNLAKQVWKDLFPAWDKPNFVLADNAEKLVLAEFERRLKELQGESSRGRKPKAVTP